MSDFGLKGAGRMVRLAAAAVLCLAALAEAPLARAAPPSAPSAPAGAARYTFAFKDADIAQAADEVLGGALHLSYTIDPGVSGQISFRIDQRLTADQLLGAFEAALALNNVALVRDGARVTLVPRDKARGAGPVGAASARRRGAGYELVAVPLSFGTPSEVAKVFQATGPAGLVVYTDDKLGILLLGGSGREIDAALETLRYFDRSGLESARTRYIELGKAPAQTVAQEVEKLLSASSLPGTAIVPLKRLNAIVVISRTPQALDEVTGWITRLDTPSREEASSLWIYRPKNLSADSLGQTLRTVLSAEAGSGTLAAAPAAPAGGSEPAPVTTTASYAVSTGADQVRVGVDKESNSLIIAAPASRWVQIQKVLQEIDRTPDQVRIEAQILEVTLSDEFRFGVDWAALAASGRLKISSVSDKSGTVGSTFPGLSITFLDDDAKAAINALGARTDVQVVSAPKLMALDNRTSRLEVGDQVPVASQTARSATAGDAPLVVTTEYRNTGIILNVTPRINGDDTIVLDVSQEVSSVARTTSSGIDSPTIQQRKLESTLIIHDGQTVALGGLISTTRTKTDAGTPWLQDIPGVGALFKNHVKESRRTELIVLITVHVIRGEEAGTETLDELLKGMRELQARDLVRF